jgi:hypothetical protein
MQQLSNSDAVMVRCPALRRVGKHAQYSVVAPVWSADTLQQQFQESLAVRPFTWQYNQTLAIYNHLSLGSTLRRHCGERLPISLCPDGRLHLLAPYHNTTLSVT